MDELDLKVHFVKESVVLSRDSRSSDKFMHGIKVLMAKNYIDNLSEETRKGMLEKAEQSIYPSFAPLGYRNVMGPNGKRIIEADPDIAPIITQIFQWYASGECSIIEVTDRARQTGLVSRGAKTPISKSNIHKLLRKRVYTGDFDWNGKTYRGSHQPLISTELFDRVQEILDGRFTTKQKVVKHEFAFPGLVSCGHCGCALVAEKKKGKYVYYHCTGNKGKCQEPYAREEVLEKCFADLLKALSLTMRLWIGLLTPYIKATQTRSDSGMRRSLDCKPSTAKFSTVSISFTKTGLMVLLSPPSLNARRKNGSKLRSA